MSRNDLALIDAPPERPVPYDIQAEGAVLGSLLLDRDAIIHVASFLQPTDFYREANGWIYGAILDLYHRREPPDLVTLSSELARRTIRSGGDVRSVLDLVGGPAYLATLEYTVPTAVHVTYYGQIVARAALMRRLITSGGQIAGLGYETALDPSEVLGRARALLAGVDHTRGDAWVDLATVWASNIREIEDRLDGAIPPNVPTGFATLDEHTDGWAPGDLIILAALTSRGKSAMALHFARAAAKAGRTAAIVSLEAYKEALGRRMLASESGVDYGLIRRGRALGEHDWRRLADTIGERDDMARRIFFLDEPTQTVSRIAAYVDQLRATPGKGCDLLIVDYLQLLESEGRAENRNVAVGSISRALKLYAHAAHIPIIALSQFSREAVNAEVPGLNHLRDSGSLEQDAGIAMFLHRPQRDDPSLVHLLLAKQREGTADIAIPLRWHGSLQRFEEVP
jgi:replicative DNA helicase